MTPRDVTNDQATARAASRDGGPRRASSRAQHDGRNEGETPRDPILKLTEEYLDAIHCLTVAPESEKPKWRQVVEARRQRVIEEIRARKEERLSA